MRILIFALMMVAFGVATSPARAQEQGALVQAVCMDATSNPHPASQTFAGQDVAGDFSGEIFRCMAGTTMRYTVDHAVQQCAAREALWYERGALSCRTQTEQERENERALLREFGPGDKVVHLATQQAPAPPQQRPRYRY